VSDDLLISADSHVNVPPEAWAEYLPAALRERAPRVEESAAGSFVVFEGKREPQSQLSDLAGVDPKDFKLTGGNRRAGSWDPAERLKDQDVDGVAAEVLYGGASPLKSSVDPALRGQAHRAYNDWLADFCRPSPDRLIGIAELPMESPEHAVAELDRATAAGHRGVAIGAFPPSGSWGDPQWEPLWQAAEDRSVPLHFHLGARPYTPSADPSFLVNVSMSKTACAEPIANFIFHGILQRHPGLRLVSVEGGVGWMAFFVSYIDHVFHKHRYWTQSPLTDLPSEYFHRQVLATFVDDQVGVRERDTIGVRNIMWSSDYPHSETTWPNSRKLIADHMIGVPEQDRRRIVYDNAAELYGIRAHAASTP
jgi:predicted TIM-barrel fold metal-dependent hydrolase